MNRCHDTQRKVVKEEMLPNSPKNEQQYQRVFYNMF